MLGEVEMGKFPRALLLSSVGEMDASRESNAVAWSVLREDCAERRCTYTSLGHQTPWKNAGQASVR